MQGRFLTKGIALKPHIFRFMALWIASASLASATSGDRQQKVRVSSNPFVDLWQVYGIVLNIKKS
jgi:hypothetical protein